jgi:hypothetical protein
MQTSSGIFVKDEIIGESDFCILELYEKLYNMKLGKQIKYLDNHLSTKIYKIHKKIKDLFDRHNKIYYSGFYWHIRSQHIKNLDKLIKILPYKGKIQFLNENKVMSIWDLECLKEMIVDRELDPYKDNSKQKKYIDYPREIIDYYFEQMIIFLNNRKKILFNRLSPMGKKVKLLTKAKKVSKYLMREIQKHKQNLNNKNYDINKGADYIKKIQIKRDSIMYRVDLIEDNLNIDLNLVMKLFYRKMPDHIIKDRKGIIKLIDSMKNIFDDQDKSIAILLGEMKYNTYYLNELNKERAIIRKYKIDCVVKNLKEYFETNKDFKLRMHDKDKKVELIGYGYTDIRIEQFRKLIKFYNKHIIPQKKKFYGLLIDTIYNF